MNFYLVSFASRYFYRSQQVLEQSALRFGFDKVFSWKYYQIIPTLFFIRNIKILRSKRGAGYWAWQPYIILQELRKLKENDVLVFCDAGIEFVGNCDSLQGLLKEHDVLLFMAGDFSNKQYTKRDTFIIMSCDGQKFWDAPQIMGGFHVWKKTPRSIQLLEEYFKYCTNYDAVSDQPSVLGSNLQEFIDHRHPQSILSLLAAKYDLPYWNPPIFGLEEFVSQTFAFDISKMKRFDTGLPFLRLHREKQYTFLDKILSKLNLWI